MTDSRVTTLVVDDEPLARAGLRHLLAAHAWLRCIGEATHGEQALQMIDTLRPELVLLDIRMPGLSGLELVPRLTHRPRIVFTTAHAEHAVTAFELGALHYLLKPFGPERLAEALERVRASVGDGAVAGAGTAERLAEAFTQGPVSRLFVRSGRQIVPVAVADIAWLEAVGDYVAVHIAGQSSAPLVHVTLQRLAARLGAQRFVRIHRTHLVNLDQVQAFRQRDGSRLVAQLRDGTELAVSRAMARQLRGLAR